ncbi:hypothetical protein CEUSTIGMA_g1519.t1 [Chlamydomonas eustigma]|uniref:Uncharacterized protein n=1 Tax=Chlamydomonas eustigma TaxID=1157962 RepID=A0A250WTK6_9CHLO|nr:hypothetical protein CEUSTIGMA_g1519.t1 [Chlamydomonas eustigma]|eukprot:GAX74069.1 hypothetical protein CEUSTIGMA_g1519.t1 [Chlamydomonas eustigma]
MPTAPSQAAVAPPACAPFEGEGVHKEASSDEAACMSTAPSDSAGVITEEGMVPLTPFADGGGTTLSFVSHPELPLMPELPLHVDDLFCEAEVRELDTLPGAGSNAAGGVRHLTVLYY